MGLIVGGYAEEELSFEKAIGENIFVTERSNHIEPRIVIGVRVCISKGIQYKAYRNTKSSRSYWLITLGIAAGGGSSE